MGSRRQQPSIPEILEDKGRKAMDAFFTGEAGISSALNVPSGP